MNLITLAIDGVLLFGIICVSVYGAAILPAGARVPLHLGPGGYTNWVPRSFGLVTWSVIGAVVFVIVIVQTRSHHAAGGHGPPAGVILSLVLALVLANHVGAVRAAVNRSGRR
jgi:hypothetical protein